MAYGLLQSNEIDAEQEQHDNGECAGAPGCPICLDEKHEAEKTRRERVRQAYNDSRSRYVGKPRW